MTFCGQRLASDTFFFPPLPQHTRFFPSLVSLFLWAEARDSWVLARECPADDALHNGSELIGKGMKAYRALETGIDERSKGIGGLCDVVKAVDIC